MKHPKYSMLAAAALLIANACQELRGQAVLPGLIRDTAPVLSVKEPPLADSAYRYDLACLHVKVDSEPLDSVRWYVADLIAHSQNKNDPVIGLWIAPNRIILDLRYVENFETIAHELAHYLRQNGDHPTDPFVRCGLGT